MANDLESSPSSTPGSTHEVADRLHSAAIHLLRRVRKVDEASGLSASRLSALSVLVFGGPTTIGELARVEQVSAPTMTRLVQALERDGLVAREAQEGDARAVRLRATPKGRRILEGGRERRVDEVAQLLESLSDAELRLLGEAAETVERLLGRPPSAASAYAARTAERRWSDLSDDSSGSGGTSG
jgi:DNA-binding MarR family transcriptional regulator